MGRTWLCLLALLLGGCVAGPGPLLFVPAKDSTVQARALAQEWREGAVLVRVHGVEPGTPMTEMPGLADDADPRRGDGRAQAWEYVFAKALESYIVVVRANGEVVREGPIEPDSEGAATATDDGRLEWNLDSDDVVQIVRRHAPEWDAAAAAARVVHWYLLSLPQTPAPHWLVGLEAETEGRTYLVNAVNGSVLPLDLAVLRGANIPVEAGRRQSVLLTPQQPSVRIPLRVEAPHHPSLVVGLRVERATTGPVNLTLARDGVELRHVEWGVNAPPGVRKAHLPWPANATYELTARLTGLAPQSFEVFWCATGVPAGMSAAAGCRL